MGPAGGIPAALSLGVGVLNEGVIPPSQQGLVGGGGPLSWQGEGGGHSPSRNGRSRSASPRRAPPGRGATSPPAHRNAPRRHNLQMNSHPIIGTPPQEKSHLRAAGTPLPQPRWGGQSPAPPRRVRTRLLGPNGGTGRRGGGARSWGGIKGVHGGDAGKEGARVGRKRVACSGGARKGGSKGKGCREGVLPAAPPGGRGSLSGRMGRASLGRAVRAGRASRASSSRAVRMVPGNRGNRAAGGGEGGPGAACRLRCHRLCPAAGPGPAL